MKDLPPQLVAQERIVATVALGVSHDLAFLVDLGAKAFDTVQGFTNQAQQLAAAGI